mgnify:CR=1 FL=1
MGANIGACSLELLLTFPDARVVEPRDGGDFVVRGEGRRDLALRVTATQIRVS